MGGRRRHLNSWAFWREEAAWIPQFGFGEQLLTGLGGCDGPSYVHWITALTNMYGKGFDADSPQVGAASLSFRWFSRLLFAFLGLPAGFPPFRLRRCGGVSGDRYLVAVQDSWSPD